MKKKSILTGVLLATSILTSTLSPYIVSAHTQEVALGSTPRMSPSFSHPTPRINTPKTPTAPSSTTKPAPKPDGVTSSTTKKTITPKTPVKDKVKINLQKPKQTNPSKQSTSSMPPKPKSGLIKKSVTGKYVVTPKQRTKTKYYMPSNSSKIKQQYQGKSFFSSGAGFATGLVTGAGAFWLLDHFTDDGEPVYVDRDTGKEISKDELNSTKVVAADKGSSETQSSEAKTSYFMPDKGVAERYAGKQYVDSKRGFATQLKTVKGDIWLLDQVTTDGDPKYVDMKTKDEIKLERLNNTNVIVVTQALNKEQKASTDKEELPARLGILMILILFLILFGFTIMVGMSL